MIVLRLWLRLRLELNEGRISTFTNTIYTGGSNIYLIASIELIGFTFFCVKNFVRLDILKIFSITQNV